MDEGGRSISDAWSQSRPSERFLLLTTGKPFILQYNKLPLMPLRLEPDARPSRISYHSLFFTPLLSPPQNLLSLVIGIVQPLTLQSLREREFLFAQGVGPSTTNANCAIPP